MLFLFLKVPHLRIKPVLRQQFAMCPALDDFSLIHHQDLIGIHHGGLAVSDHQRSAILRYRTQFRLDRLFRF